MDKCAFCEIVAKQVPAFVLYEDEKCICFLDKKPACKGHSLLIPKKHYSNLFDISENDLVNFARSLKKVVKVLRLGFKATGLNVLHASGKDAQQSIDHFHIHLFPRITGDGIDAWPKIKYFKIDLEKTQIEFRKNYLAAQVI